MWIAPPRLPPKSRSSNVVGQAHGLMPHTFPSTAQSALIVGRTPGPQPTPPSARRSVDDSDFIGEKRVQGDPRGPGGPPHNFGGIRSFGKKYVALVTLGPASTPAFEKRNAPDTSATVLLSKERPSSSE